ncbi:universal stress protein [Nocardia brasiliensis]|uniref:universal stress protein n=1 Tax=Nocardia brasiliensis TaxID=37326 RepID=UPI0024578092|nr:universal stress protein [Nocardia brasiliensis]
MRRDGPVIVGFDGSPLSGAALGDAFAEAADRGTELIAVHCWSDRHFGEFTGHLDVGSMGPNSETAEDAILAPARSPTDHSQHSAAELRNTLLSNIFRHSFRIGGVCLRRSPHGTAQRGPMAMLNNPFGCCHKPAA